MLCTTHDRTSFARFLSLLGHPGPSSVAEARDAFQRQLEYGTKRGFPRYPDFLEGWPA